MNAEAFAAKAKESNAEIHSIRSKPMNRGTIRVDYFKVGRTFFILDNSDNSQGFHRVVGDKKRWEVLRSIEDAA